MAFADAAVSVAIDIAKWLIVPIGRQFGYAFFYKKNIQALESEVEKLHDARVGFENQRDAAIRNNEIVDNKVLKWLHDAKDEEEKANDCLKDWEVKMIACCRGWIPNPKTRYVIGRSAKKAMQAIQDLRGEGQFEVISHPDVPEGVATTTPPVAAAPEGEDGAPAEGDVKEPAAKQERMFESRTRLLNVVLDSLLDVDTSLVGVYGPGGVGKSTLMKQVVFCVKAEKLFDEVAMATVSANPDVKRIQGEISEMLGLELTVESVDRRAFQLRKRLEKSQSESQSRKILVILDDLWKELDLEEVGIPHNNKGVKLLLTSRNQDVLSRKMGSVQNFPVEGLKDDESWKLFRKMVGDIADDPKVKPIAEEVVQKCMGLPILLKALATALKNSNYSQWEDALLQLRRSKDVYSSLELSYNNLDEELKTLFLFCSLMGTGNLPVDSLLKYTVGLGLFEGVPTMKRARDRLNALLHSLQASSLLLEDEEDGDYVRIHDMVCEVAIIIASRDRRILVMNNDFRWERLPKEKIEQSSVISLPSVDVPGLPEGLQCPVLKMFVFVAKNKSSIVPDSFFEGMRELRVLDFTYLCLDTLPSSMRFLENLTTLCVEWCTVKDVTIIGKLKRLEVLSFRGSKIRHLPKEIAQLCELRMLDLSDCRKLKKIEPGVLKSFARLEELQMAKSFTRWENEGATQQSNARLSELNSMPELRSLDIRIPDATLLPKDLPIGNLFNYRILVGGHWDWDSGKREPRMLKLKLDSRDTLLEKWVQAALPRTHHLSFDGLRGIKKSIHELSIEGFQELNYLRVQNCPLVQYVVRSTKWLPCSAFPLLESLLLENLVNLEEICHGQLTPESFSKLKVVEVKKCGKLKNLFSRCSLVKGLSQLEEIEVRECELFREILGDVGVEDDEDEATGDAKVEMPNLRCLTLGSLPEMRSLCNKMHNSSLLSEMNSEITVDGDLCASVALSSAWHISFPRLEALELLQLPKLDEIWCRHSSLELENLQSLVVVECRNLSIIINSHSLTKLWNLESLIVKSCMTVKCVFDLEELNLKAEVGVLPRLHKIRLSNLPNLRCMWNQNPRGHLQLRNLKSLKVEKCDSLRYLFPLAAAKALEQIKEIEIAECMEMEAIIIMEEEEGLVTDTLVFQSLSSIVLRKMSHLAAFAQGNCNISFPQLKKLIIGMCPKMRAFSMQAYSMPSDKGERPSEEKAAMDSLSFFSQKVLLPSLEELRLLSVGSFKTIWNNEDLISEPSSFCRLMYTYVEDCKNLITVFPSSSMERFQSNLKLAAIYECPSVEVIFEKAGATDTGAKKKKCNRPASAVMLYGLKRLRLVGLPKLKHVLQSESHVVVGFPNLKYILVKGCQSLTSFLPIATARHLLKLEVFALVNCNNMLEVLVNGNGGLGGVGLCAHDMEPISFLCLKSLKLRGLKSLISFSSGSCAFDFPSLEGLRIDECGQFKTFIRRHKNATDPELMPNRRFEDHFIPAATAATICQPLFDEKVEFPSLKELFLCRMGNLQKLWDDEVPLGSFRKLQSLRVTECKNLPAIFQSYAIRNFLNLETLRAEGCDSLEAIFRLQGEDSAVLAVPLRELEMIGLPRMKLVWDRDPQESLTFGKLERVLADQCGSLEYLFPFSVARGLVQLQEIDIRDSAVLEELVAGGGALEEYDSPPPPPPPADRLLFPRLVSLKFRRLQNLKRLFPVNCSLKWSLLKESYAYECDELIASELRGSSSEGDDTDSQQELTSIERVNPNLESLGLGNGDVSRVQDSDSSADDNSSKLRVSMLVSQAALMFIYSKVERYSSTTYSIADIFPDEEPDSE